MRLIDILPIDYGFGGAALTDEQLCTYSLQSIVYEIAVRAGMDPRTVDVAQLEGIYVRGFAITNVYPASSALQALSQVFLFDPSNYDGLVHFIPRGNDAVTTVTEDDIVLTDAALEQETRADSISVPRVLHLNYFDLHGGLNTDTQTSERAGDRRATGEQSLETVVVMNSNEARRVISTTHRIMSEEQKGQLQFSLPDGWLDLTVADNIFFQWQGKTKRLRIVSCELDDGFQNLRLVYDRQSAYRSNIQGYPPQVPLPPPSRVPGATLIEPLDIHILRDADDFLGCYVALAGVVPGWRGATIELSLDGGANYIMSDDWQGSTVIGELVATVGAANPAYPDDVNLITIDVQLREAELIATDLTGMLNRTNLAVIGNEIIQFSNVDEPSQGRFVLSGLLRGRFQTDAVAHAIGERFVLLDRTAMYFVPAELGYIGRSLTIRATSFGLTTAEGVEKTFTYTGQSQTEYSPAYLSAQLDATNLVVSWQGIGKLGSGARIALGAYFQNYHIEATDGVAMISLDTTDSTATLDASTLSGTITVSVRQRNQLTGLGPATTVTL